MSEPLVTAEQARELLDAHSAPFRAGTPRVALQTVIALHARLEAAEAAERRVRAMHHPKIFNSADLGAIVICNGCGVLHSNCSTLAALDGDQPTGEAEAGR